jgi:renalase
MHDVILVGAGIAGLSAAHQLRSAGINNLCVLEKSRGVGGRMSTRRIGEICVDHGAQYFTYRSPAFQSVLEPLLDDGTVETWIEAVATLKPDGQVLWPGAEHTYPRYACPQGMTAVCKALSKDIDIHLETRATRIFAGDAGWEIQCENGQVYRAKAVLLTPPPEQSFALLGALADRSELAPGKQVVFDPCFAVIAGYEDFSSAIPAGLRWEADPLIAWSALDGTKRPQSFTFLLHSTPTFTRDHESEPREQLAQQFLKHAAQKLSLPALAHPAWSQVHFWRYAMPVNPLSQQWLGIETPFPLAMAGCWCAGARVEGAFLSGQAAAKGLQAWLQ